MPRTATPPTIDGVLDDAVWTGALVLELKYETRPAENGPAPVRTRVLLAYDADALYVAFDAEDPDPSRIRARLRDRDRAYDDDFVGIVVDPFDDHLRAFEFFVNPLGVQMDLFNDDVTRNEDDTWDAIWDSAGQVNANGYAVEIAIPMRALRFSGGGGEQLWGFDLIRMYPRAERYRSRCGCKVGKGSSSSRKIAKKKVFRYGNCRWGVVEERYRKSGRIWLGSWPRSGGFPWRRLRGIWVFRRQPFPRS